ncbi:hypothetical protein DB313_05125 (plasmid) [Borrelia turcica IST7]|uniref:Lipoprotein n=1 Tax=Borrelia turcica IST7 TaxID=1104446 RepID=A0A386PNM8_9SPIR|nr:hypothetical protein [Borrelia turcica]AYE36882.1 hypothetical protein DB313_05125 [Borrelia turcica IST7]
MNKINICTLLLLFSMFVMSCSLVKDKDSDKEGEGAEISQEGSDVQSDASEEAGQLKKAVTKLTTEEVDKLKDFIESATSYETKVNSIYEDYIAASNDIKTYTKYRGNEDASSVANWKANWKSALDKLNEDELVKKFRELEEKMNKYAPKSLTDAIERLEEGLEKATKSYKPSDAREAGQCYLDAIDAAISAYIDSFISVVSRFSSSEFIDASKELATATRDFSRGLNLYSIDSITYAVSGIVNEDEKDIEKAKGDANTTSKKDREGKALSDAIDKLNAVFKAVKP